ASLSMVVVRFGSTFMFRQRASLSFFNLAISAMATSFVILIFYGPGFACPTVTREWLPRQCHPSSDSRRASWFCRLNRVDRMDSQKRWGGLSLPLRQG